MTEPTIYELSSPGRTGVRFPEPDVPLTHLPQSLMREQLPLPELSEMDVIRHFTHLSSLNYCIDGGLYPLGSCTMKYNPKINEETARLEGFAYTHPLQPEVTIQGNLALMYDLQETLKEVAGFAAVTLQPAAGAQGEFTGVMIIRDYHRSRGDAKRTKILIPDSAHGTNPATSAMSGFEVVALPSDARGNVDLAKLREVCDDTVAGLMLTNPNTLGIFDENVVEVINIVHQAGGLVYGDGANLNALLGIVRPGDLGIDIMHFNLHKTFSTPHGGGGPGSGPVGVAAHLADFLPTPLVGILEKATADLPPLYGFIKPPKSIGRVKSFFGQFGMFVRAYTYIRMHGPEGLRKVS
ncbi:MAG: glycine dehydrogenase (aminomethyl-transferring), partial [Chloroflexi bacterium HGW-Chloroflexi-7]